MNVAETCVLNGRGRWRTARTWSKCQHCEHVTQAGDIYFDTGLSMHYLTVNRHGGEYERTICLCFRCAYLNFRFKQDTQ